MSVMPKEQWADTMAGAQGLIGGCQELQGWAYYALWNKPAGSRPEHILQTLRPSILSIFRWTCSGRKEQGLAPVRGELTSWPGIA